MPTDSAHRPLACELLRVALGAREVPDRDLIARFVRNRDEDAFAELVRRHGRMVLAVGRRVTNHPQDAEDAFQAAFLVLARRAGQLRQPELLANWLFGVAYRTAQEARAARLRVREQTVSAAPEPAAPEPGPDTGDLRRVIDEELSKLPDKYRSAVVLCDLEGLARSEAAIRLNIPEGTLSSRLAYARKLLAGRLKRRGVGSTAGAVAVVLARDAIGNTIPRELVRSTAHAATRCAAGATLTPDLVSPTVSSITDGVIKAMLVHRLRMTLGIVLASGLVGLGTFGLAQTPGQPAQTPRTATSTPVPNDPLTGNYIGQRKVEKVAAKGIEDEDVPIGASPSQAVVRVEEGKLIVRQRGLRYSTVAMETAGGRPSASTYQVMSGVHASFHDPAEVSVFDMKGNRLPTKTWKEKLKSDVHVIIGHDGRLPNPRELTLFKEDTLLVVLPTSGGAATVWGSTGALVAPPALPTVPGQPSPGTAPPVVRPGRTTTPSRPATPPPPDGDNLPVRP